MARRPQGQRPESFHDLLVLNHWLLGFFEGGSFERLKERLHQPGLEGMDPRTGQSCFWAKLTDGMLLPVDSIRHDELAQYDLNIVRHWTGITEERNRLEDAVMQMKYFQYLSLLFTEIYLDWYFNRRGELLTQLNQAVASFNAQRKPKDHFQPYTDAALNKIAFWSATGSGKTLLLHVNVLQYLHYAPRKQRPDRIILLTPNEGLSRQHVTEATLAGFSAALFTENSQPVFSRHGVHVDVLDINKLGETRSEKVFAVDSFEGNNLVLVDEGHRGTSSDAGTWLERRERICADGFSFEYSATFGQAVSRGNTVLQARTDAIKKKAKVLHNRNLREISKDELAAVRLTREEEAAAAFAAVKEQYAKCILFDYSYKYFYDDGYGKESLILNLQKIADEQHRQRYLTACLLAFYQQQWLWDTKRDQISAFNLERPLWVFVGNTVNDSDSDVRDVVRFLAAFLADPTASIQTIDQLQRDQPILLNGTQNIFSKRFTPLMGRRAEDIFADILQRLFNAPARRRLRVVRLKGSGGEIALRLGDAEPFGLINIGDSASFMKLCEVETTFDCITDEFGASLFHTIDTPDSRLHVLIGSRKFTEGWSSWRVSTMGLLNMGTGEGAQIIQLFGRGVRLKGREFSLKRSTDVDRRHLKGVFLPMLETLNIFGIRANYMARFKDYLREEGITPSDEVLEVEFETRRQDGGGRLKTLKLKDGYAANQKHGFKRGFGAVELFVIPERYRGKIKEPCGSLDLYPKLQSLQTAGARASEESSKTARYLRPEHLAFIDWDAVYLHLLDYKNQRTWYNLRLTKERVRDFCASNRDWYQLYIPAADLEIHTFADFERLQDVLIRLLKRYVEDFYEKICKAYEDEHREVTTVSTDDPNFIRAYRFEIENTEEGVIYHERLSRLKELVVREDVTLGELSGWDGNHVKAICFDRHLYNPLIHIEDEHVPLRMHPLAFDAESEVTFVRDLDAFYESEAGHRTFQGRDLYLMRNSANRNRGIGFARAGNFYPDYLLWLVEGETQYLSFIDPKGIRQLSLDSPKMKLYKEIREYQDRLGDSQLRLSAFILSETRHDALINCDLAKAELEDRHILFLDDGGQNYLPKLFERMLNADPVGT